MDSAIAIHSLMASIRQWQIEHGKGPEKIFVNPPMMSMIDAANSRLNGFYGPIHGSTFMGISLQDYECQDNDPKYYLTGQPGHFYDPTNEPSAWFTVHRKGEKS